MVTMNTVKKVVIIGGGFGGAYTARYLEPLARSGEVEVTLVNRTNYFLFTPLLHEVATGALTPMSVTEPIREVLRGSPIRFIEAEVKKIDSAKREIFLQEIKNSQSSTLAEVTLPYDYLVVSSGADTNFYNVKGAKEHSLTLKGLTSALDIRSRIVQTCEQALQATDKQTREILLSFVIVGGGPTGVELAAEMVEFLHDTLCIYYRKAGLKKEEVKVTLVATSPDLVPMFPPAMRQIALNHLVKKRVTVKTATTVVEVTANSVLLQDGSKICSGTTIWVAGVAPSMLEIPGAERLPNGRVKIDECLRVVGQQGAIFALGDVSAAEKPLPMLAQVAVQQAKALAANITSAVRGKELTPFIYHEKGLLMSLGQWYATGHFFGLTFKGGLMWWLWRTIYLFNFHSWRKRFKIAAEWTVNLFYPRDITSIF